MEANRELATISWESNHSTAPWPQDVKRVLNTLKTGRSFLPSPNFPQEQIGQKPLSGQVTCWGHGVKVSREAA